MTLVLTLEQPGGAPLERSRRIEGGAFRIGRGEDCDWVLPDPTRRLSKQHCVLAEAGGEWWVTDTSTNGVHVDDGPAPLGRDRRARLADGSRLRLGDYVLAVRLEAAAGHAPSWGALPASGLFDAPGAAGPGEPDWSGGRPPDWSQGRQTEPDWSPGHAGAQAAAPAADELFDASWFDKKPLEPARHPVRQPVERAATPADHAPPDELSLSFLRPPAPPPPPVPPPAPPLAAVLPPPPPGADAERLLRAFLDGAGLALEPLPEGDPEARMRELGTVFRALSTGLAQLLRTRALVKREIGVEQTMIGATGNNPLKLAVTDDEAVRAALLPRGPGYLAPPAAIEHAFADLKAHELAVIDGVQEALRALLARLDPALLEQELAPGSTLAALFAGGRKAQYWELLKSRYAELSRSAEARFLGEAGLDFGRAYRHRSGRG